MLWRVIYTDAYLESLGSLPEDERMNRVVERLVQRATQDPYCAPPVAGLNVRVLRSRGPGGLPTLHLYYWVEDDLVYVANVEELDEGEA